VPLRNLDDGALLRWQPITLLSRLWVTHATLQGGSLVVTSPVCAAGAHSVPVIPHALLDTHGSETCPAVLKTACCLLTIKVSTYCP
jgi:hypothetical protein